MIAFLFDEDSMDRAILSALRQRGVDVASVQEHGRLGLPDEAQLRYASTVNRCFVTYNRVDFLRLHKLLMASGEHHAGVVIAVQRQLGIGEMVRRMERLALAFEAADIANRVEFLSSWGDARSQGSKRPNP